MSSSPEVHGDDLQLTLTHILGRMRGVHGDAEIVTALDAEGNTARRSAAAAGDRAERLAAGLASLGLERGDRVGVFSPNNAEHLEAYYGVPCSGLVLHTMNPRLSPAQIAYTVEHAGDRAILVDGSLAPALAPLLDRLGGVEHVILAGEDPSGALPGAVAYEELLDAQSGGFAWPQLPERSPAALCYTSGTTGNPKGVAYSHRALCIHTLVMAGHDAYRISERDRVLAVVPMFHAMGWNLPYLAGMVGADLVLPGPHLQPGPLVALIEAERITATCGVPTIWMDVLREAERCGATLETLELAICGGTQVPPQLIRDFESRHGVAIVQGWGMTETLPGAALAHDPPGAGEEERRRRREQAGRLEPFFEIRIVADDGAELPRDGESQGEIEIRGPTVATSYFENEEASAACFHDGWLRTGDVGTIDRHGWLRITDRAKDVIKSGGEWISSVDLESALMAHPAVSEAAVIAIPDQRWSERPFACVAAAGEVDEAELTEFLAAWGFERWWLPDGFAFLEEIPKTSVGKFDKRALRGTYAEQSADG